MRKPKDSGPPRPDHRNGSRFPMHFSVYYQVHGLRGDEVSGRARSVDISKHGILIETESPLPVRRPIELSVDWPLRLEDGCPLSLTGYGRVVRSDGNRAAVKIEKWEFRTRGSHRSKAATDR